MKTFTNFLLAGTLMLSTLLPLNSQIFHRSSSSSFPIVEVSTNIYHLKLFQTTATSKIRGIANTDLGLYVFPDLGIQVGGTWVSREWNQGQVRHELQGNRLSFGLRLFPFGSPVRIKVSYKTKKDRNIFHPPPPGLCQLIWGKTRPKWIDYLRGVFIGPEFHNSQISLRSVLTDKESITQATHDIKEQLISLQAGYMARIGNVSLAFRYRIGINKLSALGPFPAVFSSITGGFMRLNKNTETNFLIGFNL